MPDGRKHVAVDVMEIGQGLRTKVTEAVVRAVVNNFPFPLDRAQLRGRVRVLGNDTDVTPNPYPTGGNTSTESACIAATLATIDIVWYVGIWAYGAWMYQYVGYFLRWSMHVMATWFAVAGSDVFEDASALEEPWTIGCSLACRTPYVSPTSITRTPGAVYTSNPLVIQSQGVTMHVVEVDLLAGEVDVLHAELWCETGDSIHQTTDAGQIQGAYMMGLGAVLMEDEKQGQHVDWWDYKIPLATDCPRETIIHMYTRPESDQFWRSYKSAGEPPLAGALGIVSAIRYCLPGNFPILELPVTPNQVFDHLDRSRV